MTTLESDETHVDKMPHVEWSKTTSGSAGCMFPDGLNPLECQMAGHFFDGDRHTIGKCENFARILFVRDI